MASVATRLYSVRARKNEDRPVLTWVLTSLSATVPLRPKLKGKKLFVLSNPLSSFSLNEPDTAIIAPAGRKRGPFDYVTSQGALVRGFGGVSRTGDPFVRSVGRSTFSSQNNICCYHVKLW